MTGWNDLPTEIAQKIIAEVCTINLDEFYAPDPAYTLSKGQRQGLLRLCAVNRSTRALASALLWHVSNALAWPDVWKSFKWKIEEQRPVETFERMLELVPYTMHSH